MVQIEALDNELIAELERLFEKGLKHLSIDKGCNPKDVVNKIQDFVRAERHGSLSAEKYDECSEIIEALGVLLGFQYIKGLHWHWKAVSWEPGGKETVGVLNTNNAVFNNPIGWVSECLYPDATVNFMLHYNMMEAGRDADFQANSATPVY